MTKPSARNLSVYRGDTYAHPVDLVDGAGEPVDLSDWTWLAQIRPTVHSTAAPVSFVVDTSDAADGVLVLRLTATQTAALRGATYVWDLQRTRNGEPETLLAGSLTPTGDVSRAV